MIILLSIILLFVSAYKYMHRYKALGLLGVRELLSILFMPSIMYLCFHVSMHKVLLNNFLCDMHFPI